MNAEPTIPREWVALSNGYLLTDRLDPARAAVARGLRGHPGHPMLRVQEPEVMPTTGQTEEALEATNGVLVGRSGVITARLLQVEANRGPSQGRAAGRRVPDPCDVRDASVRSVRERWRSP